MLLTTCILAWASARCMVAQVSVVDQVVQLETQVEDLRHLGENLYSLVKSDVDEGLSVFLK